VLAEAEQLFLSRLPRRVSLSGLAGEIGVSIRTLQLAARRHRDCTLGEMLRFRLLDRARELLEHSDLPVNEIARRLGYPHPTSFARDVKRRFGSSPRDLRSQFAAATTP
jgi:AraC-like DNA-binding protein